MVKLERWVKSRYTEGKWGTELCPNRQDFSFGRYLRKVIRAWGSQLLEFRVSDWPGIHGYGPLAHDNGPYIACSMQRSLWRAACLDLEIVAPSRY
jgi:hypothetical protein